MSKIIYTDEATSTLYPSSQVDSTLPQYITENYTKFVQFMSRADESAERLGFAQNLLQNLQRWRDFDTYQDGVVESNELGADLAKDETEELTLESTYGFATLNGVVMVEYPEQPDKNEVILYREVKDNKLVGLERGVGATTVLPTFTAKGTYTDNPARAHLKGARVKNISVLFLMAMGQTISDSFSNNINFLRIRNEVDKSVLLENLKDFYQSKGAKLGIKALFKMFFAENDVDVTYPGDRMIKPSSSTYSERQVLRTIPVPPLFCEPFANNVTPEHIMGAELTLRSYLDEEAEYAKTFVNYVATYPFESEVQYTIYVDDDFLSGDFISNPQTQLSRPLNDLGTTPTDLRDIETVTVETTMGFPDEGILFIRDEAIRYTSKSANQFFGCKRGDIGVMREHPQGSKVYGPYYVEAKYQEEGKTFVSRSWPLGLVQSVDIKDSGLLHVEGPVVSGGDEVYINGPGRIDPRDKILTSFIENYDAVLATQAEAAPAIGYIGNFTAGVSGVFFDEKHVFVTSSNLPYSTLGPFSDNDTAGTKLEGDNAIHVIPRRDEIEEGQFVKGTGAIGVFADGVTAISNVSPERVTQGIVASVVVTDVGARYAVGGATLLIDDTEVTDTTFTYGETGDILSIVTTSTQEWVGDKKATTRVTSGEGAVIALTFDKFGRIITATVTNPGLYYLSTPSVQVVDSTDRGKGGVLTVTNDPATGLITGVTIANAGIDYNPLTTNANIIPRGGSATAEAIVQYYQYNKPEVIDQGPNIFFDANNGFVYEDETGELSQYGYVMSPADVKTRLNDDTTIHSPILGWAYDGNPIYGPTIFKNGKNADDGFTQARSGYYLRPSRVGELAGGGKIATNPPPESTYPMGTFIEDYSFDPSRVISTDQLLAASNTGIPPAPSPPNNALIQTDPDNDNILVFDDQGGEVYGVLNEYNGITANTPEYPEELYPGGVFFYVATTAGVRPTFPYIVGDKFYNRPISQNVRAINTLSPANVENHKSFTPQLSFETTTIDFDFNKLARHRNPNLSSTRDNLRVEIDTVSVGGVSGIEVLNGLPANSEVGDFLWFDDEGTGGGGAVGEVSMVEGSPVLNGYGQNIGTTLISHRQQIDLDYFTYNGTAYVKPEYVFVPTSLIETTTGTVAEVESYDYKTRQLIVQVTTPQLIQAGDIFYDNDHRVAIARSAEFTTYMGNVNCTEPFAGVTPAAGQFYFNDTTGTVGSGWTGITGQQISAGSYVYYDTQWNIKTIVSVFDGDYTDASDYTDVLQSYRAYLMWETGEAVEIEDQDDYLLETENGYRIIKSRPQTGGNLFVSYGEPGSAEQGDLWWSIANGRLFVYYEFATIDAEGVTLHRKQWVSAQPMGSQTLVGASDTPVVATPDSVPDSVLHTATDNTITISAIGPSSRSDGTPNVLGDLWWSTETGILYLWVSNTSYVVDSDTIVRQEWVSTDPSAIAPMEGASDVTNPTEGSRSTNLRFDTVFDFSFSASVTVTVSTTAPTKDADGKDLTMGALWWSPLTGRMYVRYTDSDGSTWAVTNPIGSVPTAYAADSILDGGASLGASFIKQLPERAEQNFLWFENLSNFQVGDAIQFEQAAPGYGGTATITTIGGNAATVTRNAPIGPLQNGCPTFVTNRFKFTITTATPCNLKPRDIVMLVPNVLDPPIDTSRIQPFHEVQSVGDAVAPTGYAIIGTDPAVPSEYGEVLGVYITSKGSGYTQPFYIYFYGGAGTGALGYVDVTPILEDGTGGEIILEPSADPRFPNGNIRMINPGRGYLAAPAVVYGTELTTSQFQLFSPLLYPVITGFEYCTDKKGIQGKVCEVKMKSRGLQYSSMPSIKGTYKKDGDQATYTIYMEGSTVGSVEILNSGTRYVAPEAIFYDLVYPGGSGAQATVTVQDGGITAVTMVDNGTGYVQPRVAFVETQGKYIGLTEDIGRIQSMKVLDPGRNISPDRTMKPELLIDTRAIVSYDATSQGSFVVGEKVYQGTMEDKQFTAVVKEVDDETQIIKLTFNPGGALTTYGGELKPDQTLFGEQSGAAATVLREGQADTPVVVDGVSSPAGFFITDESMLSRKYAVIQDSYFFSPFSYEISSPIQQSDYETIVRDCTHPVGFALFSNVIVNSSTQSGSFVTDIPPVVLTTPTP